MLFLRPNQTFLYENERYLLSFKQMPFFLKNNRFFINEYKLYTSTKNKYKNYDLDTPTADKYYLSLATIRYAKKNTEEVMTRVAEKF